MADSDMAEANRIAGDLRDSGDTTALSVSQSNFLSDCMDARRSGDHSLKNIDCASSARDLGLHEITIVNSPKEK